MKQSVFKGLQVGIDKTDMDEKATPDCMNVRIDNPIGALNNLVGMVKHGGIGFNEAIVAIHQLEDYIFCLSGDTLHKGYGSWQNLEGFHCAYDLSYDPTTKYIYIADGTADCIVKTKIDGTGWLSYGTTGSGEGNFDGLRGISYDRTSGYIYIADTHNGRVVKTKIDGTGWTTLGGFDHPTGIYCDIYSEYIYVGQRGGSPRKLIKTKINGDGWTELTGMNDIWGIHYDKDSEFIYLADPGSPPQIVKTKINGDGWTTYEVPGALGIFYDKTSGYIYVINNNEGRLIRTKIDGSGYVTYDNFFQGGTMYGLDYDPVNGIAFMADGNRGQIIKVG